MYDDRRLTGGLGADGHNPCLNRLRRSQFNQVLAHIIRRHLIPGHQNHVRLQLLHPQYPCLPVKQTIVNAEQLYIVHKPTFLSIKCITNPVYTRNYTAVCTVFELTFFHQGWCNWVGIRVGFLLLLLPSIHLVIQYVSEHLLA